MLRITRREGEALVIGDDTEVTLVASNEGVLAFTVTEKRFPGELFTFVVKQGDSVVISPEIAVYYLGNDKHGYMLGVRAPRNILILRKEIVGRGIIPPVKCRNCQTGTCPYCTRRAAKSVT